MRKIIGLLALALCLMAPPALAAGQTTLKAISGPVSGPWYVSMGLVGKALSAMYPEFDVEMLPGGALANPMRLEAGDGDLALITNSIAFAAKDGVPPYKKAVQHINTLMNLNDIARLHIIIRSDLGINSIEELLAKKPALRVAYGPKSAATWVGEWVFQEYGFNYDDMVKWGGKMYANNFDDVVNMARDGQVDMLIWLGPGEGWFIAEIAKNVPMTFLSVNETVAKAMEEKRGLRLGTIPASFYAGLVGSDVPALYAATEIIVRDDMPEDIAYKLTKSICDQKDDIAAGNALWSEFKPEIAWEGLSYPLHPGAAKYYKEKGWMK